MTKLMLALTRKPSLDAEAFLDWLEKEWLPALKKDPQLKGLVLDRRITDQTELGDMAGGDTGKLDAVVSLYLPPASPLEQSLVNDPGLAAHCQRRLLFEVEERRLLRIQRNWPDGERSPGVKMTCFMRPPAGRQLEECVRYWRHNHGPLALRVHIGLWGYCQNVVKREVGESSAPVLGVSELHFQSYADYRDRYFDSPAGVAEVMADVPHFMSVPDSDTINASERILLGGS